VCWVSVLKSAVGNRDPGATRTSGACRQGPDPYTSYNDAWLLDNAGSRPASGALTVSARHRGAPSLKT
jgi:hypothetical protein